MRHVVQQRYQDKQQEDLKREKRESERRRKSELPVDITGKPKRVIPVDPIKSPFDSEETRVPGIPHRPAEDISTSDSDSSPKDTPHPSPYSTQGGSPIPSSHHSLTGPSRTPTPTKSPEVPSSPFIPRLPIPHRDSTSSESSSDSETEPIMAPKELIEALTTTLKNINQSPTIPLPVFKGKKEEDPQDNILKVEDYFGVHQITEEVDKIKRFKDTLFETARKWAQTMSKKEVVKFDYDPKNPDDRKASMKYLFLTRFAKERRTLEAAYSAWGALTFDPNKDDIEVFILKVEELAKKLGYNEDAQVMAVKSVLPRGVYGICMTYTKLKELKTFLIELFANPKMREAVPGTASATGDSSVFSIGQHMETMW